MRATLMYGANNPVDGAVLEVILRKAEKIREELGVPVPLPDSGHTLTQALLRAVLLRQGQVSKQQTFDFQATQEAQAIASCWQDAADKAQRNRTIFAQRRLKPKMSCQNGKSPWPPSVAKDDVQRFCQRALARLGSGLSPLRRGYKVALSGLPDDVRIDWRPKDCLARFPSIFLSFRARLPSGAAQSSAGIGAGRNPARTHAR